MFDLTKALTTKAKPHSLQRQVLLDVRCFINHKSV